MKQRKGLAVAGAPFLSGDYPILGEAAGRPGRGARPPGANRKISFQSVGKNIGVKKLVAELALGVVGPAEFHKVGQFFIDGFQFRGRHAE